MCDCDPTIQASSPFLRVSRAFRWYRHEPPTYWTRRLARRLVDWRIVAELNPNYRRNRTLEAESANLWPSRHGYVLSHQLIYTARRYGKHAAYTMRADGAGHGCATCHETAKLMLVDLVDECVEDMGKRPFAWRLDIGPEPTQQTLF